MLSGNRKKMHLLYLFGNESPRFTFENGIFFKNSLTCNRCSRRTSSMFLNTEDVLLENSMCFYLSGHLFYYYFSAHPSTSTTS